MAASHPIPLTQSLLGGLTSLLQMRTLLFDLAMRDFKSRYLGSSLGLLWAFIHPTCTILIMWFVFEQGFRSQPVEKVPFILWMMTGLIPWFYFSECWGSATNVIIEHAYLVRKVRFRVGILPLVKIISALIIHLFFVGLTMLMFTLYGYRPTWCYLQVIYYTFACSVLLLGLSWLTSSLVVFLRDLGQIVAMCLQFGFWLTPIFWSVNMLPPRYLWVAQINPMYYIVRGYRDTFITGTPFWEHGSQTIYFWCLTSAILLIGAQVFRRLRPHFADVV